MKTSIEAVPGNSESPASETISYKGKYRMKTLFIAVAVVVLAGCSTFGTGNTSQAGKHPTELGSVYQGGG
jgi:uncharacterized lipoprotein YajG